MHRGKKIKQMRRFIDKHGVIEQEFKRPPDKNFSPYRKGSYFAAFDSDELDFASATGDIDKYHVYKSLVDQIKERIKELNNDTTHSHKRNIRI